MIGPSRWGTTSGGISQGGRPGLLQNGRRGASIAPERQSCPYLSQGLAYAGCLNWLMKEGRSELWNKNKVHRCKRAHVESTFRGVHRSRQGASVCWTILTAHPRSSCAPRYPRPWTPRSAIAATQGPMTVQPDHGPWACTAHSHRSTGVPVATAVTHRGNFLGPRMCGCGVWSR